MKSIVLELQRDALQQQNSVSNILRKAYIIAKKLKVEEFKNWAYMELNGYKNKSDLPDYRKLHGELKAFNPYNGYIPAYFHNDIEKLVKVKELTTSITEVETLVKQGEEGNGILMCTFPSEVQQSFMRMTEVDFEISLHIPVSQFINILDRVRNIILDWTLRLEEDGILGEDLTFTDTEKEKAKNSTNPIINYIGTMIGSQLQQNTQKSKQAITAGDFKIESLNHLLEDLKKLHKEIEDPLKKEDLASDIGVLEIQVKSPNPKNGIIAETLKSVRNIAEGITGNVIASDIITKVGLILSSL